MSTSKTRKGCIERHYYQIEADWLKEAAGNCKIKFQTINDQIQSEENEQEQNRLCALYDFMLGCHIALKNINRAPDDPRKAGSYFASLAPLLGGPDDE